ncbi:MAG: efflux RND transporter periplasmic adaptor subunit, partial [Bacteroidota bacterium]
TFPGVAQAEKEANLSFRVSGTVRNLNIKLGDRVRKGQLIASLDPIDYSIQADQATASEKGAEANLQSAETTLINARANYQRIEKLYENNSVALSEFEQAKSSYESAQSQYEAAKTQVTSAEKQTQSARNQVNYTRLTAPFSGIITAVNIEANELVGSGSPIAILSSISKPEINVGIPENLISRIKKGQKADISFSVLPNQSFKGTVQEVSFAAGNAPTYPAIIRIDNASAEIRPGMAANVRFDLGDPGAEKKLVSPVKAIGSGADGNYAFVLETTQEGSYKVNKRSVKVGDLLPDGFIVLDGLQEGDLVATAGIKSLLDGMEVTLLEE